MKKLLFSLLLVGAIWWSFGYWTSAPAPAAGLRAGGAPEQTSVETKAWSIKDCEIQPLASYRIKARVLSKKKYPPSDPNGDIAPIDLALGWEEMSDSAVIDHVSVWQSGRWYEYRYDGNCPVSGGVVATQSANVHCLPADDGVLSVLKKLRRNSFVSLEGFLVEVRRPDRLPWRSSLARDDDGNGACEIFWITKAEEFRP